MKRATVVAPNTNIETTAAAELHWRNALIVKRQMSAGADKAPASRLLSGARVVVAAMALAVPSVSVSADLPDDWLVGGFDTNSRWITGGLALGLTAYLSTADTSDIRDLGDITQFVPGAFGLAGAVHTGDWEGVRQFGFAAGTAFVATHGLKQLGGKERPDGSDDLSFPSGHTSASAMGAAFVWRRYGAKWGMPAATLAAYTGISRVRGQKHFADDVISGAAIGLMSNLLWTDPIDDRVSMSLFATDGGAGVAFEYDASRKSSDRLESDVAVLPERFFSWEMGRVDVSRNLAGTPALGGPLIDWRFDQSNNPTVSGMIAFGSVLAPGSRHGVYGVFSPLEVREETQLSNDTQFRGTAFPSGTEVQSRYVANDYRLGYGYSLFKSRRFLLTATASLAVFDTVLELGDGNSFAQISETVVSPTVGARLRARVGNRWMLIVGYGYWSRSEVELSDATIQLGYQVDSNWLVSIGYRGAVREIDTDQLVNKLEIDQITLGVSYLW